MLDRIRGLLPRPRLVVALAAGAALIALAQLTPLLWLVAAAYHCVLVALVVMDAGRLPRRGWVAQRDLPNPLSLGVSQEVLIAIRNPRGAGLEVAIAD
ncbi:MAG: hypothetical protein M3Z13_07315, partial [Candidatus Dormibacteraeota bacterium]|nr:hypothetical protein [Candidatus Dormibacteraeota bacterium]